MPELSAIVVSHRSAREASSAIAALRRAFAETRISGEIVLVDCGSGGEETAALRSAGADRLIAIENRGYAGGVNAGLAAATGRLLALSNADVELAAGALAPLLETASRSDVGACAPVQHADPDGRLALPSGFGAGFARDAAQTAPGSRGSSVRFARHASRQWRLWSEGGETDYLAGSFLVARKEVFDRVGRFDERYPFEYEETEWEDRVRAAGLVLRVVAASRARHAPGTSAARNPETAGRRRTSRHVYRRWRYGRLGAAALAWLEKRSKTIDAPAAPAAFPARSGHAVAVSPNPSLLPFAAASLEERPAETAWLRRFAGGPLYARIFRVSDGAGEAPFSVA